MVSVKEIKAWVKPKDVALRYLGEPISRKGDKLWYKSPFRPEERTESFIADDRGFYDFGTSKFYDVISFIEALFKCDFKEAVEILSRDYGLSDNEYENPRIMQYLKRQQEENRKYTEKVEKWFSDFSVLVDKLWQENHECVKALKGRIDLDGYAMVLDREIFLEGLYETILETTTFKDKEYLHKKRGEMPKWLRNKME